MAELLLLFLFYCPPFLPPALFDSHLKGVYIPVKCTYTPLVFAQTLWTYRHRRRTSAFSPLTAVNTSSGDPLQNKRHKHTEITLILRTVVDWNGQYMGFHWTIVDVINGLFNIYLSNKYVHANVIVICFCTYFNSTSLHFISKLQFRILHWIWIKGYS